MIPAVYHFALDDDAQVITEEAPQADILRMSHGVCFSAQLFAMQADLRPAIGIGHSHSQ
jgi:hypothetical protein